MKEYSEVLGLPAAARGAVATIGNFDGLHRGHQAILDLLTARARQARRPNLLITFDPHPLQVLAPERGLKMITTRRQKMALLEAAGIDFALVLPFTMDLAMVSAERFVHDYLSDGLKVNEIYVGGNFNFGRGRGGDAAFLVRSCRAVGIQAHTVPEVRYLGSPISSSRIRQAILAGEVELVRELLGRPFGIEGTVVHGAGRGAGMGIPTANLSTNNELVPQDGVYITEVVASGRGHASVTNLGSRPTFAGSSFAIEAHLLDDPGDLYGQSLEVRFLGRLREELKFESSGALVRQVQHDIERARAFFAAREPSDDRDR